MGTQGRGEASVVWNWSGRALPPSTARVEPWGWACCAALAGAAAAALALAAAWKPLPGLALPPGALSDHAWHWAASACHSLSRGCMPGAAAEYRWMWDGLPDPESRGLIVRAALGALAFLAPAIFLAGSMLRPRDGYIHVRRPRRHVGRDAARALSALLAQSGARRWGLWPRRAERDQEIAPGVEYPARMWTRGALIVGGVGSGKSTALRWILGQAIARGEQVLAFDAKGELTSEWARPSILAPWDKRSLAWDIAKDVRNVLEMERFAAVAVRDSSDPMWASASRQILVGAMLSLRGERGEDWGWAELRDALLLPREQLLQTMLAWHPVAARSLASSSVTSAGILINLSAYCAPIFHLARAWGAHPPERRVSFVEWTLGTSKRRQIILQGHDAYGDLPKVVAEGALGVVASLVASVGMRDDLKRRLWIFADEASRLGQAPLETLYSLGRSRGARCVAATQDLSQLERVHGAPMVKSIVSMVGTLVVGQSMPGESADALCKALGKREVERRVAGSHGAPEAFHREEIALYAPSELASRLGLSRDERTVRLILSTGGDAYELDWPVVEAKQARPKLVLADWLRKPDSPYGLDGAPRGGAPTPAVSVELGAAVALARARPADSPEDDLPAGDASRFDELDAIDARLGAPASIPAASRRGH